LQLISESKRRQAFKVGLAYLTAIAPLLARPLPAHGQQPAELGAVTTRLESEIHKILDETGIPAISIALVRDGDVVWTGTYGWANVGAKVPATPDTYFSTGSTFKFVTATAVMQLVEQAKLTLDTPLNDFVGPKLAVAGADDVTFRHLLSHNSGLQGPVGTVPLWSRTAPITPLQILEGMKRIAAPGTVYRYCNECFGIMAWVVQKASGQTWDQYVYEHILKPLGVDMPTPSIPSPIVVEHLALPYALQDNAPVPIAQVRYDVYSAGDVYLRAEDMARFLAAQLNGGVFRGTRILSEASAREMQRQQFPDAPYGLGTGVVERDGRVFLQHSGAIPGFNSVSLGEPATRMGVYIMSNSGSSAKAIGPLARLALGLMSGEHPDPLPSFASKVFKEIQLDTATFDRYVGQYQLASLVLTVSREGSSFFIQGMAQQRFRLYAASPVDFFLKDVEADLTFVRDAPDGPVTAMIFRQGGQEQRAKKIH
jgi:D-alanyl-D-alanine-carboxypeptidase/D-alanyl-D-alanine-endopeptidase